MNNIYDNYTLEDMKFQNPVEVQTESAGTVIVEKGDEEIIKKIDELATAAWKRDNETLAGWEYFADIAEACNVNFFGKSEDDYGEKEPEQIDIDDLDAFGSDELIDDYKE